MNQNPAGRSGEDGAVATIQELFDRAILAAGASLKAAQRAKAALVRAKAGLADRPVAALEKLLADWRPPDSADFGELNCCINSIRECAKTLRAEHVSRFQAELARTPESPGRVLRPTADGFTIGPLSMAVNAQKLSARLVYAKLDVAKDIPLSAQTVMKVASELEKELFGDIPQANDLATHFEQAVKVAFVRQEGRLPEGSIRAELPRVYIEMALIRQGHPVGGGLKTVKSYSVARFVVELVTLIRSEINEQLNRFRLETAVLENTGNAKKAIFVPNDLMIGHGEGSYYQAWS